MIHVHGPAVFQQQAVVEARDGAVPPPLVVYAPGFEDCLDGKAAAGEVYGKRTAGVTGFDGNATGGVERVGLIRRG
jgi:hypothetical protein